LQSYRGRRLERGYEQTSCVIGPVAPQRFGGECERAVADDGDLDGAELEAVEPSLRLAQLGRVGECGGGERSGPDSGRAATQEHPTVEHEHVRSPLFDALGRSKNKPLTLITEAIFYDMIDREIGSIFHDGIRVAAFVCRRG
jgi:hypothetical protein